MKKILKAFFISIFVFNITASAEYYVRPCGEAVGIKMYTDGLLVVGKDNNIENVKEGDILISANGRALNKTEDLSQITSDGTDEITFEVKRKDKIIKTPLKVKSTPNGKTIGLWLRDSTAGIGTLTYITSDGDNFAALGHGITDIDTGDILTLKTGTILNCSNVFADKSEKGNIGSLNGVFNEKIGDINVNAVNGIYGDNCDINTDNYKNMRVAELDEIKEGNANILCNVDGGVKQYDIEIKKVSKMNTSDKTIVLEITDKELLSKTGGIVQGMSGSPIIQDNLFVGAVTHVFINEPQRGFGVAGISMIENSYN